MGEEKPLGFMTFYPQGREVVGFSMYQALNSVSDNKEGTCGIAQYLNYFRQYRRWAAFLFLVVLPSAVRGRR